MPLKKTENNPDNSWAIWEITESEAFFHEYIKDFESIPERVTSEKKRLEWLAGRFLVKRLMESIDIPFAGIIKNEFGKPFPAGSSYQLSLSHSYPYVAAYLHQHHSIGIDLEQPKPKLLKVASRVLSHAELEYAQNDLIKHCITWCAKEVLVKVYGKKDLIFAENLKIEQFPMAETGHFIGSIIVNGYTTVIPLYFEIFQDFALVLNKPK